MKTFLAIIIGFAVGLWTGSVLLQPEAKDSMKMDDAIGHHTTGMGHEMLEVDTSKPVPTVTLLATKDSKDGYNLQLVTENFTFTPENVGGAPVANEGHAHLFVNGNKVARLYGDWFSLSSSHLKEGENIIEVSLNANDHSEWTVEGQHIGAEVTISK